MDNNEPPIALPRSRSPGRPSKPQHQDREPGHLQGQRHPLHPQRRHGAGAGGGAAGPEPGGGMCSQRQQGSGPVEQGADL